MRISGGLATDFMLVAPDAIGPIIVGTCNALRPVVCLTTSRLMSAVADLEGPFLFFGASAYRSATCLACDAQSTFVIAV